MQRPSRIPKRYRNPRKVPKSCEQCKTKTEELYQRVDESNYSITYWAPYLCKECYQKVK